MTPKRFNFYIITWLLICLSCFVVLNWSIYQGLSLKDSPSRTVLESAPNSIFIPKLNLSAPIVLPDSLGEEDINQALNQGVVSLTNKEKNSMVLIGHSSVYAWQKGPYGQVFAQLDKLSPSDEITIFLNGQSYLYQVKNLKVIQPNDLEISQEDSLILITCWPPGTTEKRLIVQAK